MATCLVGLPRWLCHIITLDTTSFYHLTMCCKFKPFVFQPFRNWVQVAIQFLVGSVGLPCDIKHLVLHSSYPVLSLILMLMSRFLHQILEQPQLRFPWQVVFPDLIHAIACFPCLGLFGVKVLFTVHNPSSKVFKVSNYLQVTSI